ncbi:unnamed protein product [Rotaria socialis]
MHKICLAKLSNRRTTINIVSACETTTIQRLCFLSLFLIKMPLAQNYKDDMSRLEYKATKKATTMDSRKTNPCLHQGISVRMNVSF